MTRPARYPWTDTQQNWLEDFGHLFRDKFCAEHLGKTELAVRLKKCRLRKNKTHKSLNDNKTLETFHVKQSEAST